MARGLQRANDSESLAMLDIWNGPRRCSPILLRGRRCRKFPPLAGKEYERYILYRSAL